MRQCALWERFDTGGFIRTPSIIRGAKKQISSGQPLSVREKSSHVVYISLAMRAYVQVVVLAFLQISLPLIGYRAEFIWLLAYCSNCGILEIAAICRLGRGDWRFFHACRADLF